MKRNPLYKHIYKRGKRYCIEKRVNGGKKWYKSFTNLNDAIQYRDRLKANDWKPLPETSEEKFEREQYEFYENIRLDSYGTTYGVVNSKKYYGTVKTIEEALYYRDLVIRQGVDAKPKDLDLITDNPYIGKELDYPLPERLVKPERNTRYRQGSIVCKGRSSFHVHYGKKGNGYKSFICACPTWEMAEYVRREMRKCDWDRSKLDKIIADYPKYYTYLLYFWNYITWNKNENIWILVFPKEFSDNATIDGIRYKNVEDALFERDFLKAHNWDYDLLVESIDDTDNPYYDMELPPYPTRRIRHVAERNYHEKELKEAIPYIQEGCSREEVADKLGVTSTSINNWLKKFWNSTYSEFKRLVLSGENPLTVLEKQEKIYQPDLSHEMPPNFNNYVSKNHTPYGIRYVINRRGVYYGTYTSEKQALAISKDLAKVDYDKSKLKKIQKKHGYVSMVNSKRWVYPNGKGWCVRRKNKDKRMVTYGSWRDKRIAESVRDMLILYGWNLENSVWIEDIAKWYWHCRDLYDNNMFGEVTIADIEYFEAEEHEDYLHKRGSKYFIMKNGAYYGIYPKEKAIRVREFLMDNNWDKELLNVMLEMGEI